ncbi:MAG: transglycosylase SLT domain-containing protein [Gammaproteobacteria bacterium]|jgi:soluble lytic murein transglycosylase|nr:transglycosylase SLT domain-containing protein [Gammaproteobacteria bacterium]
MKASVWKWLLIALVAAAAPAAAADRERDRAVFVDGWQAAARGDQADVLQAIQQLPDYPLTPYLQFELFRQRIDQVPAPVMTQFLARYRDWSFFDSIQRAWLRSLGERGEFDLLLAHGRQHGDTRVRCHVARALIERGETDDLESAVRELWLSGRSRPDACNEAFAWWRRQGNPDADTAWHRFRLAVEAGERRLAGYLKRYLPADERSWADRWLSMSLRPHVALREARQWRDIEQARSIVRWGLERRARSEWESALDSWRILSRNFRWSEAERASIEREIALFRAVDLDAGAVDAIDTLPADARDDQILAWRARAAMAGGDWQAVLESIEAMSIGQQAESRWRYWRGRALGQLRRPDALLAFASLSAEADYHGFLSAHRLGQPLSLCEETLQADSDLQRRLLRNAEFERVFELFHVGLDWHARRTWRHVSRRMIDAEREQAALIAAGQGWHHFAITALNEAGLRQAYPWRFPMAAKGTVMAEARRYGVDPALAYGLMRAESAMQPDARSPAGALGLLQLMPATASAVASRNGLAYRGAESLTDPAVNVPLGIAHLAELYRDFGGNWIRVAAAYNAGANAVRRWLDERPDTAPDVWIETMPYYETRDYVPRVLAFATIYEWQLERRPELLTGQVFPEGGVAAGFACPP